MPCLASGSRTGESAVIVSLPDSAPPFTDAGLLHLGKIESLKQVDIHGTAVTKAGAARLHELLPRAYIYWGPLGESAEVIRPVGTGTAGGGSF